MWKRACIGVALALLVGQAIGAFDLSTDADRSALYPAQGLGVPLVEHQKMFLAEEDRAGFTTFEGAEAVAVRDGVLTFTLTGERALLGWGNYEGKLAPEQVPEMWQGANDPHLRVRQFPGLESQAGGAETTWTVLLWRDGEPLGTRSGPQSAQGSEVLRGTDWQVLDLAGDRVGLFSRGANPDGMAFTVEGRPGTRIEIEWLRLVRHVAEGVVRHEFALPEGEVWHAVAEVGSGNDRHWTGINEISARLYVNGAFVERPTAVHLYHTEPVDIGPYLQPGRNCVGFYGFRVQYNPFIYLHARVVMASGEVVEIRTNAQDWRVSPEPVEGWSESGFDDADWPVASTGFPPTPDQRGPDGRVPLPAYSGRLLLTRPGGPDLMYRQNEDITLEVRTPPGLAEQEPMLDYLFGPSDAQGACSVAEQGTIEQSEVEGKDQVFRIPLGRQAAGVYAVALRLRAADGTVIEERLREPVAVIGQFPQPTVSAQTYRDGLELELEDEIDFTDPDDPHPSIESRIPRPYVGKVAERVEEPVIVRKGDLVYREVADARRGSGFSYRIAFQHPGDFYLLELDYPDDAKRTMDVAISTKSENVWTNSQSGVGAETGGRFLSTNDMRTLRWLHVADHGPHTVDVLNVVTGEKAAARALRIWHVTGPVPSAGAGTGRLHGIHTERCFYTSGVGMNFGMDIPRSPQEEADYMQSAPPMALRLRDLVWLTRTAGRYTQYLRFAGQNCFVMGCIQYRENNSPYVPLPKFRTGRVRPCMRTILANTLDANGIDFFAGLQFSQSLQVRSYANNAQLALGADSVWMVNGQGEQNYGHTLSTIVPNWLHPEVRAAYLGHVRDLERTFGHLDHFRGLHSLVTPSRMSGYYFPSFSTSRGYENPLDMSFDDITCAQFEEETGIAFPADAAGPQRFQRRAQFLRQDPQREDFMAWRCAKLVDLYAEALDLLHARQTDLDYLNTLSVGGHTALFEYLAQGEKRFDRIMFEHGVDLDGFQSMEHACVGRWTISWRHARSQYGWLSQDPYIWMGRTDPGVVAAFEGGTPRYVLCRTSWDENYMVTGGHSVENRNAHDQLVESDWVMNAIRVRALPQPAGPHAREAYVQAMITADPDVLLGGFTDLNINVGHEQAVRSVLRPYTHLPRGRFEPVLDTGLDTNLAIRQLVREADAYLYVANPGQWPIRGTVTVRADALRSVPDGQPAGEADEQGVLAVDIDLPPFGLAAFRALEPELAVLRYETSPTTEQDQARLRNVLDRVELLLSEDLGKSSPLLSEEDQAFMTAQLREARAAFEAHEYARMWMLVTHHRFWSLWQTRLREN